MTPFSADIRDYTENVSRAAEVGRDSPDSRYNVRLLVCEEQMDTPVDLIMAALLTRLMNWQGTEKERWCPASSGDIGA